MGSDSNRMEIRPATAEDIEAVYGSFPRKTMRAYAALYDGKPVAVAGVYYYPDQVVAFSKILPEYAHLKAGLGRGALKVLRLLKEINKPVLAVAEPSIPTSPEFLERCGFEYIMTNSQGRVYAWRKH
jgi:hypothetical protein